MKPCLLAIGLLLLPHAAQAEPCAALTDKVAAAAAAEVTQRSDDFASFRAGEEMGLTLSCGGQHASSVGVQHRGQTLPDRYFVMFGQAGFAVTGVAAETLSAAAQQALANAKRLRHSNVEAGGARVICSYTGSEASPLTMCAVVEQGDRS